MAYVSKNPYNNEVMAEFDTLTDVEFEAKIAKAEEAFKTWKETSFATRTQIKKKHDDYERYRLSTRLSRIKFFFTRLYRLAGDQCQRISRSK
ncbi:aldehyde dehydrogenase family protein [Ligilactobacillus faecis]|uniref:aldehyde dehydrogenase family protein n=1 Tax=Ligilactobacillus faecis TaxID=762833 RepID=UPI0035133E31